MPKKKSLNDDDIQLFREVVGDVKPVVYNKVEAKPKKPAPIPKQKILDEQAVIQEMLSDHYDPHSLNLSETIHFARPGIQHSVMKKLKKGQYVIEAELDLHGFTVNQARRALVLFLNQAQLAAKRCVRVIHGKGRGSTNKGPVLKPMVANWLLQRDEVLAYCTAKPADGGGGAVYVLLKKNP